MKPEPLHRAQITPTAWGGGSFRTKNSAKEYLSIIQILAGMTFTLQPTFERELTAETARPFWNGSRRNRANC